MKVLHVAAEVFPLVKTGGLADVVAALPAALVQQGADPSEAQAEVFLRLAARSGKRLGVMMAVDTGLGREGVRDIATATRLATRLAGCLAPAGRSEARLRPPPPLPHSPRARPTRSRY